MPSCFWKNRLKWLKRCSVVGERQSLPFIPKTDMMRGAILIPIPTCFYGFCNTVARTAMHALITIIVRIYMDDIIIFRLLYRKRFEIVG